MRSSLVKKKKKKKTIDGYTDQFQELHILSALDENPTCDYLGISEVIERIFERI